MAIGPLFHLIHLTDDAVGLDAWYRGLFAVRTFQELNYSEYDVRDASLLVLGDAVIEPIAPAFRVPGWEAAPLGRFYRRFGRHWHSIAWYVDDAGEMWQRCVDAGIRVVGAAERPGPDGIFMTHPKDTVTQLQFVGPRDLLLERDPRRAPDWDPDWWVDNHPVATPGLAYATVLTRDLDRAERVYTALGGTVLHRDSSDLTGTEDVLIRMGPTVVQLSRPTGDDSLAAADLAANNETLHAAAFRVGDLDATEGYLQSTGVRTLARDDQTLLSDPTTTHGAPLRWTTREF